MKRKIILSLILAFIMCFSSLCFFGCDNRVNNGGLTVTFKEGVTSITLNQYTRDTYESEKEEDDEYDYLGAVEKEKIKAMKVIENITGEGLSCFHGTYYARIKGEHDDREPVLGFDTVNTNAYITAEEYDKLGTFAKKKYRERTLTAYEYFLSLGGVVNGFNISKAPGTYEFTFQYNGMTSAPITYVITDPSGLF